MGAANNRLHWLNFQKEEETSKQKPFVWALPTAVASISTRAPVAQPYVKGEGDWKLGRREWGSAMLFHPIDCPIALNVLLSDFWDFWILPQHFTVGKTQRQHYSIFLVSEINISHSCCSFSLSRRMDAWPFYNILVTKIKHNLLSHLLPGLNMASCPRSDFLNF